MATVFPTLMPVSPDGDSDAILATEYTVGTGRVGNDMAVYVAKFGEQPFHKYISLKRHWYHFSSPAQRIRRTIIKAQKIADKLNHDELYINHEAEISTRILNG